MRLIPHWRRVIRRAWSVRLALLSAAASGASACWFVFADRVPPVAFLFGGAGLSVAAVLARVLDQGLSDDAEE